MKWEFLNICFDQCFIFIISCTFCYVFLFQDFSRSMKASMYFKKQSLLFHWNQSMIDMMSCNHLDRWSFNVSDESLLEADDSCIRIQSRLHFSLFCQFNAQITLSLTRLFESFSFFSSHFQHTRKSWIVIKYDSASEVWMTLRRCVMMKRCALIACRVFAIAQTSIISIRMLQAICTQMRKSNRTQNYEKNRLWKSFNSVSCRCVHDDKNWDRTFLCLICWKWLAERTWITNIL